MKIRKTIAAALVMSIVLMAAGCSKVKEVTTDDFLGACEAVGAKEYDFDELEDIDEGDFEDGIYAEFDYDDLEDLGIIWYLSFMGVSIDDDTIDEGALYIQGTGVEDLEDVEEAEDLEDIAAEGVAAVQLTLEDDDMAEDIIEVFEDFLDDYLDVDVDDLSRNEYFVSENSGYLKLNVELEDVVKAFKANKDYEDLIEDMDDEDLEDLEVMDNLGGQVSIAVYVKNETVVFAVGFAYGTDASLLNTFCGKIGITSPAKVKANTDVAENVAEMLFDYVETTMEYYTSIDDAVAAIEDNF